MSMMNFSNLQESVRFLCRHAIYSVKTEGDEPAVAGRLIRRGFRKPQYRVSRDRCFYRCIDLSHLESRYRKDALDIQVRKWAPIDNYLLFVSWREGIAQVWITSADNVPVAGNGFLPESVFVGDAGDTGSELLSLTTGFEGRIWREGILVSSRYWAAEPEQKEWVLFLRGAGAVACLDPVVAVAARQNAEPWSGGESEFDQLLLGEKPIVSALILLFACLLVWQSVHLVFWQREIDHLNRAEERISGQLEEILIDRAQVRRDQTLVDLYNNLRRWPGSLSVLALVADAITEADVVLRDVKLSENQLQLKFSGASLELTDYVEAFEQRPGVSRVTASKGNRKGELHLAMTVDRPHDRSLDGTLDGTLYKTLYKAKGSADG